MKKFTILILFAILLTACGTSQSAVQTAIAQTAASQPTPTSTATLPPPPTATPEPTSTKIPSPPLVDSFVTNDDFATLAEFYQEQPLPVKSLFDLNSQLQEYCGYYVSKADLGDVVVCIYEFENSVKAQAKNILIQKTLLTTGTRMTIPLSSKVAVPNDFWAVDNPDGMYSGATYNSIMIITWTNMENSTLEPKDMIVLPMMLTANQVNHLKSDGF